jgi:hypothetical protein
LKLRRAVHSEEIVDTLGPIGGKGTPVSGIAAPTSEHSVVNLSFVDSFAAVKYGQFRRSPADLMLPSTETARE